MWYSFMMRYLQVHVLLGLVNGSTVILPSEYIGRNTDSPWFSNREHDVPFSGCMDTTSRSYEYDSLPDISLDPSRSTMYSSLMALFVGLSGSGWRRKDNWGMGDPCFQGWYGVDCDCTGRVTRLNLADNSLRGSIPSALAQLTDLSEIYLQTTLRSSPGYTNPYANEITGAMPNLGNLQQLRVLDISLNSITSLPTDISMNINLEILSATGNQLTSIPSNIGALVNLKVLELGDNLITSPFPAAGVCSMSDIYVLSVGNNSFSGSFVDSTLCIQNLNPLIFDISGPHPSSLGSFDSLKGDLPKSIAGSWSNINDGYLSVYRQFGLTGDIPGACIDLRFCYKSNFMAHGNLAWIAGDPGDVPQSVYDTVKLASQ